MYSLHRISKGPVYRKGKYCRFNSIFKPTSFKTTRLISSINISINKNVNLEENAKIKHRFCHLAVEIRYTEKVEMFLFLMKVLDVEAYFWPEQLDLMFSGIYPTPIVHFQRFLQETYHWFCQFEMESRNVEGGRILIENGRNPPYSNSYHYNFTRFMFPIVVVIANCLILERFFFQI